MHDPTPVSHGSGRLPARQVPPVDPAARRANVLAALDLERHDRQRRDPIAELERRLERLEAALYALARSLDGVTGTNVEAA